MPENAASAHHFLGLLPIDQAEDVADDLTNVVVGNLAGPAGADTFSPVDKHHGDDGDVPLWLHALVVIKVVFKQVVVYWWEKKAGQRTGGGAKRKSKYMSVKSSIGVVDLFISP